MEYRKPLFFILFILFIAGCVYLYFLTAPATPIPSSIPTATTQKTVNPSNSTSGQSMQSVLLPNQEKSPDTFTTSFYTWYLQGLSANQGFVVSDKFKSAIGGWLTQSFILSWNTLVENTWGDPVLLAQDYQGSWGANIQTTILNQTATTSEVLVSLGTSAETHRLTVHLELVSDAWRISSVTPAQ